MTPGDEWMNGAGRRSPTMPQRRGLRQASASGMVTPAPTTRGTSTAVTGRAPSRMLGPGQRFQSGGWALRDATNGIARVPGGDGHEPARRTRNVACRRRPTRSGRGPSPSPAARRGPRRTCPRPRRPGPGTGRRRSLRKAKSTSGGGAAACRRADGGGVYFSRTWTTSPGRAARGDTIQAGPVVARRRNGSSGRGGCRAGPARPRRRCRRQRQRSPRPRTPRAAAESASRTAGPVASGRASGSSRVRAYFDLRQLCPRGGRSCCRSAGPADARALGWQRQRMPDVLGAVIRIPVTKWSSSVRKSAAFHWNRIWLPLVRSDDPTVAAGVVQEDVGEREREAGRHVERAVRRSRSRVPKSPLAKTWGENDAPGAGVTIGTVGAADRRSSRSRTDGSGVGGRLRRRRSGAAGCS